MAFIEAIHTMVAVEVIGVVNSNESILEKLL